MDVAHPDWYPNLVADPHVAVEIGDETCPAHAATTEVPTAPGCGPS
jgi:F420H(2)-dependent quinone reductase